MKCDCHQSGDLSHARDCPAACKHKWDLVEEYGGHFVTRCIHCRVDMLRDMLARAAIARARGTNTNNEEK